MSRRKSDAQIYLEQVEKLDAMIECKLAERQQMYDLALSITAGMGGERVQSSSASKSKLADAVDKCLDMADEIASTIDDLIATKAEVVHIIDQVDDPTQYKVLHMRYIQHIPFTLIADKFGSDYTWATTCHGRAIKKVEAIMAK